MQERNVRYIKTYRSGYIEFNKNERKMEIFGEMCKKLEFFFFFAKNDTFSLVLDKNSKKIKYYRSKPIN